MGNTYDTPDLDILPKDICKRRIVKHTKGDRQGFTIEYRTTWKRKEYNDIHPAGGWSIKQTYFTRKDAEKTIREMCQKEKKEYIYLTKNNGKKVRRL